MSFEERWLIRGELVTLSKLHLGDGGFVTREGLVAPSREDPLRNEPVEVASVATDATGRPYLPGSTLKGALRSWLARRTGDQSLIEELLGSKIVAEENAQGSRTEFWDSPAVELPAGEALPYWCAQRLTGVEASVAIDRRTRTAAHEKLFHREFVPAGTSFEVTVACRGCYPEGLEEILVALAGFDFEEDPVTLGSSEGDGWGRFSWCLKEIRRLDRSGARRWLDQQSGSIGWAALEPLGAEEITRFQSAAAERLRGLPAPEVARLSLKLEFQSHFLVNELSLKTEKDSDEPDQRPRLDSQGRVLLPASSFRGALRGQAERILRTIGGDCCACPGDGGAGACQAIQDADDVAGLCLACRLFGAAGWRSPLRISDFAPDSEEDAGLRFDQEFIAIDRFTGGGADKRKFKARSSYRPTLSGEISLDLSALRHIPSPGWVLALLCLLFRDLREEDITLGYGAAKGYGRTTAGWESLHLPTWKALPECLRSSLDEDEYQGFSASFPAWRSRPERSLKGIFDALERVVRDRQRVKARKEASG